MWRLILFITALQSVHGSCPSGFDFVGGGECRGQYGTIDSDWRDATREQQKYRYRRNEAKKELYTILGDSVGQNSESAFISHPVQQRLARMRMGGWISYRYLPAIYDIKLFKECNTGVNVGWAIDDKGKWACVAGSWTDDVDCTTQLTQPIPPADQPTPVCSFDPYTKEGQTITSPGFPYSASTECDFYLQAAAGKRVEVEIQVLEANTCCDSLVVYDGYGGAKVLATLTGETKRDVHYNIVQYHESEPAAEWRSQRAWCSDDIPWSMS